MKNGEKVKKEDIIKVKNESDVASILLDKKPQLISKIAKELKSRGVNVNPNDPKQFKALESVANQRIKVMSERLKKIISKYNSQKAEEQALTKLMRQENIKQSIKAKYQQQLEEIRNKNKKTLAILNQALKNGNIDTKELSANIMAK
jgi:uncharacterized protein YbbC (DUF1343 family)